jgi:hypothetical protein
MIIMGTSLKVFGLQKIVREFAKAVHARKKGQGRVIFVNRTRPAETTWDGVIDDFVAMDCDDWVHDLRMRRPDIWLRQGDIELTVTKSSQSKRKRNSSEKDANIENRPMKKKKMTVEVAAQPKLPSTPSRKTFKLPPNYLGRTILSPLAQAQRPPFSPLSSPVRMHEEHTPKPIRSGTPLRPMISPFTPGVLSGSKLKTELFRDQTTDQKEEANSHSGRAVPENTVESMSDRNSNGAKQSNFVAQVWRRVRPGQFFPWTQEPDPSEEPADDDVIEVETPSRGPRGRKIDVFEH